MGTRHVIVLARDATGEIGSASMSLEDALARMNYELPPGLATVIDRGSVTVFLDIEGDPGRPPPPLSDLVDRLPPQFRRAFAPVCFAAIESTASRNPFLAIDTHGPALAIVAPGPRIDAFLREQYGKSADVSQPPVDGTRWVVLVGRAGDVFRVPIGLGPLPGIGQA